MRQIRRARAPLIFRRAHGVLAGAQSGLATIARERDLRQILIFFNFRKKFVK